MDSLDGQSRLYYSRKTLSENNLSEALISSDCIISLGVSLKKKNVKAWLELTMLCSW